MGKYFLFLVAFIATNLIIIGGSEARVEKGPVYLPKRSVGQESSPQEYLKKYLPSSGHTVLVFYKDTCNPCKRMQPLINNAANVLSEVTFLKIDWECFKDLGKMYAISSVPTLIFLQDGKEVDRYDGGPLTQEGLIQLVKDVFE